MKLAPKDKQLNAAQMVGNAQILEVWKSIPGFKGYYKASNLGRIKSVTRTIKQRSRTGRWIDRKCKGKILRSTVEGGYCNITLCKGGGKKRVDRNVHTLVALAFIGPRPPGKQVRHLDGDCTNNYWKNLKYGTPQKNMDDRTKHGRTTRGVEHHDARLSEKDVVWIRENYTRNDRELGTYGLAKRFGVHQSSIWRVLQNKSWSHVR